MPGPAQLHMPGADVAAGGRRLGYVAQRRSAPARNVTSLEMTLEERALLCALAEADGVAMSEVLRRGLRLYAAHHGVTVDSEVDAAA